MSNAYAQMLACPQATRLLSPAAVLHAMLDLERAMVLAQAELGLVDRAHAQTVTDCCLICAADLQAEPHAQDLVAQAAAAGSLAIPLVNRLKATVRDRDPKALAAAHLGATSQDLIDTAMSLQGRQVLALIDEQVRRALQAIVKLKRAHGRSPLVASTLMQPAAPTVLEARLLNWALPLQRSRQQLAERGRAAFTLQLAGAVGDGAAWGSKAVALRQAVADRLGLPLHPWAWHAQRDDGARLAAELGVLVGALAKVGLDVALMSQAEVGELQESVAVGRGGSSAMPHKRNPVGAMVALAALQRAPQRVASAIACMASPYERGLGQWQAEGAELADLLIIAAGSATAMANALEHAAVDPAKMAENLKAFHDATGVPPRAMGAEASSLDPERERLWAELESCIQP